MADLDPHLNLDHHRIDSIRAEAHAAATLLSSNRTRAIVGTILAAVVLPAAGWIGAKIDTKNEVSELTRKVSQLSKGIDDLTKQQKTLADSIEGLSREPKKNVLGDHGGQLFVLSQEMIFAQHNIVSATALALAHEPDKVREQKQTFAKDLAFAYDQKVWRDGKLPSEAAELVLGNGPNGKPRIAAP